MTSSFYKGKKVVVTGGAGFVGSHVVEMLLIRGAMVVVPVRPTYTSWPRNLNHLVGQVGVAPANLENVDEMRTLLTGADAVMHLAADIGGVQFSSTHQASTFQKNLAPFMSVIEASRLADVGRFLVCSSACVYPADAIHPTSEAEGFRGFPQVTNEGYGMSKRMQEYLGVKYVEQYGMDVRIARPFNGYGPRDDFDPSTSHVIPALIQRVHKADDHIEVWGDGSATRSFLYVDDFARGLLEVAEKGPVGQAVNLGPDEEVSIRALAETVVRLSGKNLGIKWNTGNPVGQQQRGCDTSLAKAVVGFSAQVGLDEGLSRTVDWFRSELSKGRLQLL